MSAGALLIDETARPSVRDRFGAAMAAARFVDVAVRRIRLAALDLTEGELAGVRRCRLLLGELDASTLLDMPASPAAAPPADPGRASSGSADDAVPRLRHALARLRDFAGSGRLEVRSAGLGAWTPDFCVARGPAGTTCMVGAIYFGSPHLLAGPAFTLVGGDEAWARLLSERFDALWERGHDVLPAIQRVLAEATGVAAE